MGVLMYKGINYTGGGGGGGGVTVANVTYAEYQALSEQEKMSGTIYNITDRNAYVPDAEMVVYDNTTSGLLATDVQAAVDEVNQNLTELGGIRYNEETYWIQVKNGTEWVNYKYFNPNPVVALIPQMTSNTTPSGTASASSIHSAAKDAYTAFDRDESTAWTCASNGANVQGPSPNWVCYDFGHDTIVTRVVASGYMSGSNYSARTFTLQGYDGSTWTDMNVQLTVTSGTPTSIDVDLSTNEDKYSAYRFYCATFIGVGAQWNAQIIELQLYGYDNV